MSNIGIPYIQIAFFPALTTNPPVTSKITTLTFFKSSKNKQLLKKIIKTYFQIVFYSLWFTSHLSWQNRKRKLTKLFRGNDFLECCQTSNIPMFWSVTRNIPFQTIFYCEADVLFRPWDQLWMENQLCWSPPSPLHTRSPTFLEPTSLYFFCCLFVYLCIQWGFPLFFFLLRNRTSCCLFGNFVFVSAYARR